MGCILLPIIAMVLYRNGPLQELEEILKELCVEKLNTMPYFAINSQGKETFNIYELKRHERHFIRNMDEFQ